VKYVKRDDVGEIEELYLEAEYPEHTLMVTERRTTDGATWMRMVCCEVNTEIIL
jgi:hypothetical protein